MKYTEWKEIHTYCLNKDCVYESKPFGDDTICYRIAGKIFAQLTPKEDWYKITLKTNPEAADFYRRAYPGVIVRGYHCPPVQQPYWNTIELYHFDKKILFQMIDEAYEEVIRKLPKKEQKRLPNMVQCRFVKTNGEDKDFVMLCGKLDDYLDEAAGEKVKRQKYVKYNQRDSIHDVFLVYRGNQPVACGAYKFYDEDTMELKRIYVDEDCREGGIGAELLRRLEADAKIAGYKYAILETGELLQASCRLYKKQGYTVIPNYGQYADMPESLCMQKKL